MDSELGACLFHKHRWELGGWWQSGWLWCCGRSCWWCSRRMTKQSSPTGLGWGRRGANERRIQSRSTPSEAKSRSLWTCGPVPSPAATSRVCHRPPDCTRGSPHSSAHPDTLWCWLSSLTWNHTKDHNRSRKLCFYHPGHVPVIRGNPDLHFEGAGNGRVVITWIGRVHELYSGTSPISLVEHCVTFRHDRRLLSLLGFVHNCQLVDGLQQKKKKKKKKEKPVFIKRKWNHVVFSRATILSFHPVIKSWHLGLSGWKILILDALIYIYIYMIHQ